MIYMFYYINSFFIYSFFGYILEFLVKTFIFKGMNSGILYGPWLPVYGLGGIISIFMMRLIFNRVKANRVVKIFLLFICNFFLLSLIEYLGGILIETIFHKKFWNYSEMKFSFGPYVSLEMSLLWGIGSLFLIYVIKPIVDPIIKKIPIPVTVLVSFVFIMDVVFTFLFH